MRGSKPLIFFDNPGGVRIVRLTILLPIFALVIGIMGPAHAQTSAEDGYMLQPGDTLQISVWREDLLNLEVTVLPDGNITFPLAGRIMVKGLTTPLVESAVAERLADYLAEPVVTVVVSAVGGNRVYLLGKVNVPGPYVMDGPTTISQILSLAGGFDRFAELDEIKVLRGIGEAAEFFSFDYDDLTSGTNPQAATMLLQPGDVIIVP